MNRDPRLTLRFALYAGIALVVAAGAGFVLARRDATSKAKRDARAEAAFIASRLGRDDLAATGLRVTATGDLRAELDDLFDRDAAGRGVVRVSLFARDGAVTYSTDHSAIGQLSADAAKVSDALLGRTAQGVGRLPSGRTVLVTFVPVHWLLSGSSAATGVLAVYRDYRPVERQIRHDAMLETGTLTLALLLLYAALFPILRRVTRVLHERHRRLAEQAEELRASEARYRVIVETAAEGIWLLDADRRTVFTNKRLAEMLGYTPEELVGRRLSEFVAGVDLLVAEARNQPLEGAPELVLRRRDGGRLWVTMSAAPIFDAGALNGGSLAMVTDVTARKQAQAALGETEESLVLLHKTDVVGRLTGGIAHEFSNALTAISGYGDRLLERLDRADPLRREAEEIRKEAERGIALTRRLAAFGRRGAPARTPIDLGTAVADAEALLRRVIGEDVELEVVVSPGPRTVEADPGELEQAVASLVLLARGTMPLGGRLVLRVAEAEADDPAAARLPPGRYVALTVSGGPEALVSAAGVAAVSAIVGRYGGALDIQTEPGKDTTLRVFLPSVDARVELPEQEPKVATGSETILVVEDEEVVRAVLREALEEQGYTVLAAANGRAGLELVERHGRTIELVVTDLVMPELSGRELAERVSVLYPETLVLFMSGYPDDVAASRGGLAAGVAFLQKPFSHAVLARKVRELLDGRAALV